MVHSGWLLLAFVELFCDILLTFRHVCANSRPDLSICPDFVDLYRFRNWTGAVSSCRLILMYKSASETSMMCGTVFGIFGYSYEKPGLLYEYPGKLPDVYFSFSAFFPFCLPLRESAPTESCFRILYSFSPGSSSGSFAYYQIRLVPDAALYNQPQGSYVEVYLAHLFGCLEEGGQRLETEVSGGVEARMRADARDALDFRLRYVRQCVQRIDKLS